jgi:hypothetical protein
VADGFVEYVDTEEEETTMIAMTIKDLQAARANPQVGVIASVMRLPMCRALRPMWHIRWLCGCLCGSLMLNGVCSIRQRLVVPGCERHMCAGMRAPFRAPNLLRCTSSPGLFTLA